METENYSLKLANLGLLGKWLLKQCVCLLDAISGPAVFHSMQIFTAHRGIRCFLPNLLLAVEKCGIACFLLHL